MADLLSRPCADLIDAECVCGFLVHSFSGDDPIKCRDHVRNRLGLPEFEKINGASRNRNGAGKAWSPIIATYIYRTADGQPYLQVRKTAAKDFFQSYWNGSLWVNGKPTGAKLPYRLPQLSAASRDCPSTPRQSGLRAHQSGFEHHQASARGRPSAITLSDQYWIRAARSVSGFSWYRLSRANQERTCRTRRAPRMYSDQRCVGGRAG
jgi:hypothetical protein